MFISWLLNINIRHISIFQRQKIITTSCKRKISKYKLSSQSPRLANHKQDVMNYLYTNTQINWKAHVSGPLQPGGPKPLPPPAACLRALLSHLRGFTTIYPKQSLLLKLSFPEHLFCGFSRSHTSLRLLIRVHFLGLFLYAFQRSFFLYLSQFLWIRLFSTPTDPWLNTHI